MGPNSIAAPPHKKSPRSQGGTLRGPFSACSGQRGGNGRGRVLMSTTALGGRDGGPVGGEFIRLAGEESEER
jgi:hypothetical protein